MKRMLITVASILLLAGSAMAQAKPDVEKKPAGPMPTVDQILDNYVKALGGKDAIMKTTSRVAKGTFELPAMGISATIETYAKAPNKSALVIDIPGFGMVLQGYNGTIAWSQDPQSGLREKTGTELAETKRDEDFYRDARLKELYAKLELKGVEQVGGRDAYVIQASAGEGSPDKMYFDKENGLLVRTDLERESPMGRAPIQVFLDNYKEMDGVKQPLTVRQVAPIGEFIIKFSDIKHNVPIDDAKFNKPAAQ